MIKMFFSSRSFFDFIFIIALVFAIWAIRCDYSWITKRTTVFITTSRLRDVVIDYMRTLFRDVTRASEKHHRSIDFCSQSFTSNTFAREIPDGRNIDRDCEKNGHGFLDRSTHFSLEVSFRRMRAQSWNQIPCRASRQCQLRSRLLHCFFSGDRWCNFDLIFRDQTIYLLRASHVGKVLLLSSSLHNRGILFIILSL